MQSVIAIVGRPNVGKSTLFNRLTGSKNALVAEVPGMTRDRQYGYARIGEHSCLLVDTGGLAEETALIDELVSQQSVAAIEEATLVLFLVDGRDGLMPADREIADRLRRSDRPVVVVVNKTEGRDPAGAVLEFHDLGLGLPLAIAATHGRGFEPLRENIVTRLPSDSDALPDNDALPDGIRVAVAGRPNVGKSTLINRLLGEERVLAHDMPGTTRDSIYIPFKHRGDAYVLIDTAGVRRRARVEGTAEKFSVVRTLQAVTASNVVILLIDAREGITDQDAHLLGITLQSGRALVIAVNKWDGLDVDERERVRDGLERKLRFIDFANIHFISALQGSGVGQLFRSVSEAWYCASKGFSTPELNRILSKAVEAHPPPLSHGRRAKLRYAHQGGRNPPIIVVHGSQTDKLKNSYKRYLSHAFSKALKLRGTPLQVEFKTGKNPYEGRKNVLTPRQQQKRKRLMRHVKGKR